MIHAHPRARRLAVAAALASLLAAPAAAQQQPATQDAPPRSTGPQPDGKPPAAPSATPSAPGPAPGARPSPGPKGAQTARPSPAAEQLARALVPERSWTAMIDGYAEALSGQMSQALQARGEPVPDGLGQKVKVELGKALGHAEGLSIEASELASRFSDQELRSLATFYRSPAGQKLVKELPEMSASVDRRIRERLTEAVPGIVSRLTPSLAQAPSGGGQAPAQQGSGSSGTPPEAPRQPPAQGPGREGATPTPPEKTP